MCLEIWEPQIPVTLKVYPGLHKDSFYLYLSLRKSWPVPEQRHKYIYSQYKHALTRKTSIHGYNLDIKTNISSEDKNKPKKCTN